MTTTDARPTAEALEAAALDLLDATETLHEILLDQGDPERMGPAYERREVAFSILQSGREDGEPPTLGPAAHAAVARVRTLDAEILEVGWARAEEIRVERQYLRRRRSVIQAHSSREREQPRVVTVKV
ncbi:MAG: hypothetical protein CL931_15630 [Deltaproteobacteria bacterium]|nr:hypothetical protein [Deltaproteobacteria bacterium]